MMKYLKEFKLFESTLNVSGSEIFDKHNLLFKKAIRDNNLEDFKYLLYEYLNLEDEEQNLGWHNGKDLMVLVLLWAVEWGREDFVEELLYLQSIAGKEYTNDDIQQALNWAAHSRKGKERIKNCEEILKREIKNPQ